MSFHHAVVWLDHTKAQVIHFDLSAAESESLKTHSAHPHPHIKHGESHASDNTEFFKDIAEALKDSLEILVVGPAEEKTAFVKYLTENLPAIAGKIKGVETVDHPSEGQLLAHARKHFLSTGGLH
jgi:stalled ribosome rescue protein Dom34